MGSKKNNKNDTYFSGKLLVATPSLKDHRFDRTVIYMCGHDEKGGMGLVINKLIPGLFLDDLLKQMELKHLDEKFNPPIYGGGPVEMGRGFVLHSPDVSSESSLEISKFAMLNGTTEMLEICASPERPKKSLFVLGYAGWGAGQLEAEIQSNSWLVVDADEDILFRTPVEDIWKKATRKLGIDPVMLSAVAGHA